METETKLHDRESSANPGSESFDSEELLTRTVGRGAEEIERRYKLWLRAETAGLAVVIIVVWGLLLLPVIFYHLPHIDVTENNNSRAAAMESCDMTQTSFVGIGSTGDRGEGHQSQMCATPIEYTGSVCQQELESLTTCLLGESERESAHPLIITESNLEAAETVQSFIDNSRSGLVSPACAAEVKPFLCLHLFGLCSATGGVSYQPTACHCKDLRDNVCADEWRLVEMIQDILSGFPALPNCDVEFPDSNETCYADNKLGSTNGSSSQQQNLTCSNITCHEGFYCKEDASNGYIFCNPSCHMWKQYPHATNLAIDFLVLMSACIGVVSGVGVLVVAGIRWKKVLVFPSSLTVYQTITLLVIGLFTIITYVDSSGLYCTSEDLFISLKEATPFCIITGVIFYYSLFQLAMFWFCNVSILFWKIRFPFHSRSFPIVSPIKYRCIHVTAIALSVLAPFVPVIATMSQNAYGKSAAEAIRGGLGFGITRFPPIGSCLGNHVDTTFYSLILPVLVLLIIGLTMLILLSWTIHKQHGLFKARQSRNPYKIGTAERKLLIAFVYYVVFAVMTLTIFTLTNHDRERFSSALLLYFECESKGVDPKNPCDTNIYIKMEHIALTSISYILLGLFPMFNFIFVVSVRELKEHMRKWCPCLFKATISRI